MKLWTNMLKGALMGCVALSLAGCGQPQAEESKSADLVYVNWAEGVAYTHLAKVVLEEKMGYEVNITAADVGPAYTAAAQGDKDAYMECWPGIHKDYLEKFEGQLVDLGTVYEGTKLGLAVPTYVTIDNVAELKEHADKFDGTITGIDAGAGIMKTTENELIPQYDLDMKLMASSGPAMTAALKDAIDNEEWIVVTAWKPHWMFGRFDLKMLEQSPDKMIWEEGNIHIMGRKTLPQDKPELTTFLRNFKFTDAQLSDLMLQVEESDEDVETVARRWMNENEELVQQWLP